MLSRIEKKEEKSIGCLPKDTLILVFLNLTNSEIQSSITVSKYWKLLLEVVLYNRALKPEVTNDKLYNDLRKVKSLFFNQPSSRLNSYLLSDSKGVDYLVDLGSDSDLPRAIKKKLLNTDSVKKLFSSGAVTAESFSSTFDSIYRANFSLHKTKGLAAFNETIYNLTNNALTKTSP